MGYHVTLCVPLESGAVEVQVEFLSFKMCENHSLSHYQYLFPVLKDYLNAVLPGHTLRKDGYIEVEREVGHVPHIVQTGEVLFQRTANYAVVWSRDPSDMEIS